MPKIGEKKRGGLIGKSTRSYFVWLACIDCGKERWVKSNKPSPRCIPCAAKKRASWCRGAKSGRWKGGRFIHNGYAYVKLQPDDFFYSMANGKGYVAEHRLVVAKALGRCLLPWEVPHHKTGFAKDDNKYPETLELITDKRFHIVDLVTKNLIVQLQKKVDGQNRRIILLEAELVALQYAMETSEPAAPPQAGGGI